MDKVSSFELRVIKQALLEWIHSKTPVENCLAEVFAEHRVGSRDRPRIRSRVFKLLRDDSDVVVKLKNSTGIQSARVLEDYLARPINEGDVDKRHLTVKPSFEKDPKKHLAEAHGYSFFEGQVDPAELEFIHMCLHRQRTEPSLCLRVDRENDNPNQKTYETLKQHGFVANGVVPHAYSLASESADLKLSEISSLDGVRFQDLSSQLVAHIVNWKSPSQVLDYCAGNGGKSLQILDQADQPLKVTCYDSDYKRLSQLADLKKKRGLDRLNVVLKKSELDLMRESFDHVLVDAPCSGLGTLRRHSDLVFRQSQSELKKIQALQLQIIYDAATFLKRGGILTYVTCTFRPEENDRIIENLVNQHKNKLEYLPIDFQKTDMSENFLIKQRMGILLMPNISRLSSQASGAWMGDCFYIAQLQLKV